MTHRRFEQDRMNPIWVFLCAYGPYAFFALGVSLLAKGGLFNG